jgi:hypothetical protein
MFAVILAVVAFLSGSFTVMGAMMARANRAASALQSEIAILKEREEWRSALIERAIARSEASATEVASETSNGRKIANTRK